MSAVLTITPGPGAMSGMVLLADAIPSLVIALDPVSVAIHVPETEDGREQLHRFCLELSLEAGKVAAFLNPHSAPDPDWRF